MDLRRWCSHQLQGHDPAARSQQGWTALQPPLSSGGNRCWDPPGREAAAVVAGPGEMSAVVV